MRILFATSEVFPLIKTGGLADVCYSLPLALETLGHEIKIILPFYRSIKDTLQANKCLFQGKVFGYIGDVSIYSAPLSAPLKENSKIEVLLVDAVDLFDREGGPYVDENNRAWGDSAYRFAVFSRVVAMLGNDQLGLKWKPDIVHCNDWQTGLVVPLLKLEKNHPATMFTIHNLAYQGNFSREEFDYLLLPEDWWAIDGLEFYGECSFLKAGVMQADWVTTVSPTYAKEVQTPEFGERFEGILQYRKDHFVGILNGADYSQWSPQQDPFIDTQFSASKISLKRVNKAALQAQVNLPISEEFPLFGMICRLVYQKGIDLVIDILPTLLKQKVQIVLLGSGDIYYETALKKIEAQFPDKLSVIIGYNEALSHQIEAGADFFLMPSRYEPCGLNQIYSLSYGTLPIVRNTGGLADTVNDSNNETLALNTATGFVFEQANPIDFYAAIERAIKLYENKKMFMQVRLQAMSQDFSWEKSSREYQKLYRLAVNNGAKNINQKIN
tara:strand:+ start:124183 stop:125676 length:1494 start_codon:yes stop_codon:yes gene_type:complete